MTDLLYYIGCYGFFDVGTEFLVGGAGGIEPRPGRDRSGRETAEPLTLPIAGILYQFPSFSRGCGEISFDQVI